MDRLQRELLRLYGPLADPLGPGDRPSPTRSLVLELARPADWSALCAVWQGVQADLGLPAPAIAVNGRDGCQLWFSLLAPVPVPRAGAFLDALRRRYLGDIAPVRVAMLPLPTQPVPELQADRGLWSAFVASDLVPMFTDEPWLDLPPNPDGQAQLLESLKSITPTEFDLALQQLNLGAPEAATNTPAPAASLDPQRFLLDVMNNPSLDLALRIEAAKALLPYVDAAARPATGTGR